MTSPARRLSRDSLCMQAWPGWYEPFLNLVTIPGPIHWLFEHIGGPHLMNESLWYVGQRKTGISTGSMDWFFFFVTVIARTLQRPLYRDRTYHKRIISATSVFCGTCSTVSCNCTNESRGLSPLGERAVTV